MSSLTVLSPSTVAIATRYPLQIEIWDWREGACLRHIAGFGGEYVLAPARLPDGRFLVGGNSGAIRVGSFDNWAAATVMDNGRGLTGVLVCADGSFMTTDHNGDIKVWRDCICEITLPRACSSVFTNFSLTVVGRRLVFVGTNNNLLVAE